MSAMWLEKDNEKTENKKWVNCCKKTHNRLPNFNKKKLPDADDYENCYFFYSIKLAKSPLPFFIYFLPLYFHNSCMFFVSLEC